MLSKGFLKWEEVGGWRLKVGAFVLRKFECGRRGQALACWSLESLNSVKRAGHEGGSLAGRIHSLDSSSLYTNPPMPTPEIRQEI
jgi:hypothetical protein